MKQPGFGTRSIHAGQEPEPVTGSVMIPIFQTSTYAQKAPGEHTGYEYARTHNPTRAAMENCIASLEGAKYGIAFSSGLAAITTCIQTLKAGDHVLCTDDVYGGTFRLFERVMKKFNVEFTFCDLSKPENFEKNVKSSTKILWIESPTNPTLKLLDIEQLSAKARHKNIRVIVDNTFMSPYFQQPLALGADVVMHSSTKYLNGHSDVVGGILVTNDSGLADEYRFLQNSVGSVPAPLDCFLILRGLKTLHLRMQAHQKNALILAEYLSSHPHVESVIYPGLASHPQHALAKKQMSGFGGMMCFRAKGGLEFTKSVLSKTRVFTLAESLGGVESLVEHPAIMTHASMPQKIREALGITDNLIRLSVGVEDAQDLVDDINQALMG